MRPDLLPGTRKFASKQIDYIVNVKCFTAMTQCMSFEFLRSGNEGEEKAAEKKPRRARHFWRSN
jgi:hypothetical protein